jgi:hypothetical protein
MHNNKQRKINTYRMHHSKKVSDVVIHDFFKNKEAPATSEGFSEVKNISFEAGPFTSEQDRETYNLLS